MLNIQIRIDVFAIEEEKNEETIFRLKQKTYLLVNRRLFINELSETLFVIEVFDLRDSKRAHSLRKQ